MHVEPFQALAAAQRPHAVAYKPRLLIAGATGVLGNEVLRRLAGPHRFDSTHVLAREPVTTALRGVELTVVPGEASGEWPLVPAETGIIMFEPPRLFHDRERALWTPQADQVVEVATWMRMGGVTTLVVVMPHDQGRLPEALKRGLVNLDEQALATLGLERLIIVRTARKPARESGDGPFGALARFMLSTFRYMLPGSEQPVRAVKVAQFVSAALELAPPRRAHRRAGRGVARRPGPLERSACDGAAVACGLNPRQNRRIPCARKASSRPPILKAALTTSRQRSITRCKTPTSKN